MTIARADVEKIVEIDDTAVTDFTTVLTAARMLASRTIDTVTPAYTADEIDTIETYLAAHIYTQSDRQLVQELAGPVQATRQSKIDLALNNSHYGQMAMILDTAGSLADLNRKITAKPSSTGSGGSTSLTVSAVWLGGDADEHAAANN